MTLTRILAELAINTNAEEIPQSAYEAAKKMTLDSLACVVGGANEPACPQTVELAREWGGREDATAFIYGGKLPLPNAVLANSVMTHALDYDDVYIPASLHVTSVMFPIALSTAEYMNASGRDYLAAFIIGTEVACLLGRSCMRKRNGLGFLPTSVEGIFGGVAAASRLMGLDVEQTVNAMGIAYAQAGGNRQAPLDMTLTKRMQPAYAARDAIYATALAKKGITGAYRALEGECGLFKVYLCNEPPQEKELQRKASDQWQIERLSIKQFTSCGSSHPLIEAALILAEEENLNPDDVEHVEISYGGRKENALVSHKFSMEGNVQVNAQFSTPYGVALALVRRTGSAKRFTEEKILADKEVIEFEKCISMVDLDEELKTVPVPQDFPPYTCQPHTLKVFLKNGEILRRDRYPAQTFDPEQIGWNFVCEKLHECAEMSGRLSDDKTEALISATERLDSAESIRTFIETHLT